MPLIRIGLALPVVLVLAAFAVADSCAPRSRMRERPETQRLLRRLLRAGRA
jgi:hypothetical protein